MELTEIRDEIDRVDSELLSAFLRRMELSKAVAEYKAAHGLPTLNSAREREILDKVAEKSGGLADYSQRLFDALFELSRSYQDELRSASSRAGDKANIVIIGMPGSGKTTIGRRLAELTGRRHIETDDFVQELCGKTVPEIFYEHGEKYFRMLEAASALWAGKLTGAVISTGGGIVTTPENRIPLRQNSRVYELKRPIELLATEGRPLSTGTDALRKMYAVRRPLYEAFRDVPIENTRTIDDAAEAIWRDFCAAFTD